jgi:PTS system D-glucosamine-specific IIC component
MMTGITEPLEFSFLFVAPALFAVQVVLAGSAYMIAHILNIAVGLTFSGGFLDLFLFGILQGNDKTSWLRIIPVGIIYFFLYYFIFRFLIQKYDFKTPGREDDDAETKLYTKADVNARKAGAQAAGGVSPEDEVSRAITRGLGGKRNISDVDCCATRLRCTVYDAALINDAVLKATGASGVVHKGNGVQVIYGPHVTVIKSNLEYYLEKAPDEEPENVPAENTQAGAADLQKTGTAQSEKKVARTIVISSPIQGVAADLSTAPDEAFAQRMMGDGAVVTPVDPFVRAPEDGEICFVFDTKHAIGFLTDSGISLLIHVGIDTVKLEGAGFETLVETGQKVKKGEPMLKLDLDYLKEHAPSLTSPVLCTELEDNQKVRLIREGEIKAGEALFAVDIYE